MTSDALRQMAAQLFQTANEMDAGHTQIRDHSGMYISAADDDDTFVSVSLTFGPRRTLQ